MLTRVWKHHVYEKGLDPNNVTLDEKHPNIFWKIQTT